MKFIFKVTLLLSFLGLGFLSIKFYQLYKDASVRGTSALYEPVSKKIEAYYNKLFIRSSVYEFLRKAFYTFGIEKKGIIHIGARHAEELDLYESHGIHNILWIEADPEAEEKLNFATKNHPQSQVAIFAATDQNGTITLRKTSNDGHSSSILKLKNHLIHYPNIKEVKAFEVPQKRLDDFISEKERYNIIVIDVQGAELTALKGAEETLKHTDAIIAELNYDELYEGAVLVQTLDQYLLSHGFTRVDTISIAPYTGDALYIKNKFFKQSIS